MKDDFEESVLGSGDCQHWRTALERRGVDEATIAELSTAGQALVATVNSAPGVGIAEQTSILESTLYYLGQGTTTASSVGSSSSVFLSELTQNDFREYLVRNAEALEAFERNRERRKSELEASGSINGGHGGHGWEQGQGLVESMKTVPHMFFREEYDLSDAETYARALGSSGVGNLGGSEGEQEWAEAIEKLSLYVDDVEVNLLREVQARAHQFLDATGTITALQRAISQACVAIGSARRGLRQNERATSGAMAAMRRLRGEREALEAVLSLATALEDCHHATEALRLLLPQRDYASILDVMGSLERSLGDGGEHGGVGASGLRCVAGALKKMEQTRAELIGDMSADFVRLGLGSVGHPQRPGGGLGGGGAELVDAMLPLVLSLHRTGALADAVKSFYDTLEHRLKSGAPELLWALGRREAEAGEGEAGEGEAGEGEGGHGDGDLRDLVSGLALDSYLRVQSRMVKELRTWARSSLGGVRMAVEAALKESFFVYSQGFDSMADCLEDSVASFWVRVLQMRQACHRSLKLSEFLRHVSATRGELGGDQGGGRANGRHGIVRNALNAQCKSYLEVVHKYCKTKVVSALQHDQWRVGPVSAHVQDLVRGLEGVDNGSGGSATSGSNGNRRKSDVVDSVVLGDHPFRLVTSLVPFVQAVSDLLSYSCQVPQLATECAHRVIEIFKVYNALCCSLILGAGAMEKAGLKSISAKHLASAHQAVTFVSRLLPAAELSLARGLLPLHRNILSPQFKSLARDLGEHRNKIEQKLVKIMQDRLSANLGVLVSMAKTWDAGEGGDGSGEGSPSQFARAVVKQLTTLKTALSFLLEEDLDAIFGEICRIYDSGVARGLGQLERGGDGWRRQVRADAEAVLEGLMGLPVRAPQVGELEKFVALIA